MAPDGKGQPSGSTPCDGRHSAALTVVSGAATVIVGTANLGTT
jgi:hypothetical protein